jgi:hypothetical protein
MMAGGGEVRGGAVCSGTALLAGRSQVRSPTGTLEFYDYLILPAALSLWSPQLLTEMSTRRMSWGGGGKGGRLFRNYGSLKL